MHASEIWTSEDPKARLLRAALTPLSWLYAAGWKSYVGIYRIGLKRAAEPHRPVVVVGNLAVGGSGKSPATMHIARLLREEGREVVIGCSGYGSPRAEAAAVAPPSELDASKWGDEPAMFRWLEPSLPLVVGRRRVMAAELVHREFPSAVLVMDDGFQHLPLRKHVSLLLEESDPPNAKCLPAGPYREPRRELRRADAVVWTDRTDHGFCLSRGPLRFVSPELQPVEVEKANLLCALGQPEKFLKVVRSCVELENIRLQPDHDPLTSGSLLDGLSPGLPTIVTAKDWVKLRERADVAERTWVIALQDVTIEPADQFREWLLSRL